MLSDRLSDRHYQRLASVVQDRVGIRLPATKRTMVEGRLRKRVRALGLSTLDEYGQILFERGELESEFVHLVDLVTTNKTDFFREPDHFEFLANHAVAHLLGERRGGGKPQLKLWSAACSIGAEAYTIAMVLTDMVARSGAFRFSILGTDICTDALAKAALAVYPDEMMAPVPPEMLRRYVMRARNATRREVRIVPELRRLARFAQLNLMDAAYPFDHDVDVIFCRNVLIYFDRTTQHAVLERLCRHLRPGGYLFLGHAESSAGVALSDMRQAAPTVLQRA